VWHTRLHTELLDYGFTASNADPSLYTYHDKTGTVYLLSYVDDILIASSTITAVDKINAFIKWTCPARDLGEATYYLGINLFRDRLTRCLKLSHERAIFDLVSKFDLTESKPRGIPMSAGSKLTALDAEPLDSVAYPYATLVGSLLLLTVTTRPDIAFAVGVLSCFMAKPLTAHWHAAKGVLRYLLGTAALGITFRWSDTTLSGFVMPTTPPTPTPASPPRVTCSSSMAVPSRGQARDNPPSPPPPPRPGTSRPSATKEALWLRKLLADLKVTPGAIGIKSDNQGALKLLRNPISSLRTKHIDVAHHFARERVMRGEVSFFFVSTSHMLADALTKALPSTKFELCRAGMGMEP
jgi:hypothetical protein